MSHSNSDAEHSAAKQISIWWLAVPLGFLVLAMVAMQSSRNGSSGQDSPAIGKPAPQIDLVRIADGPQLDAVSQVSPGEVTLVHFWGTWCGPCKMEYPELAEMAGRMQSAEGFRFVPISCEGQAGETLEGLASKTFGYFESAGIDSLAYADPRGVTRRSAAQRLGRTSMFYPTSILVGPDGNIAGVWEGYTPESVEQIKAMIEQLLDSRGRPT